MKFQPAIILESGAICAMGSGVPQIEAAVRAGLSAVRASSVHNRWFEPVTMGLVPEDALPPLTAEVDALPLTARQRRMLRLATPALVHAAANLDNLERIPLLLGLPEAHPKRPAPVDSTFLDHLRLQTGMQFHPTLSQAFPRGRAAALIALDAAMRCLTECRADVVVVGGVDSYLDLALLGQLEIEERVLGDRVMDGFIPAEGAAFITLCSTAVNKTSTPRAAVLSAGTAHDPGHRYSDQPAKGEGLSQAIAAMLAALPQPSALIRRTFAGLNGESFGAKEWGVARLRHKTTFAPVSDITHPADCYGDPGAASGALLAALAHHRLLRTPSPAGASLLWASSDAGDSACAHLSSLP
jgi:3-oxoacyl-[acyl-carrier-protein] synthase I